MKISFATGLIILTALTACASQKSITSIGDDYKKANTSAEDALSAEIKQARHVRRIAATVAYINDPQPNAADNLDPKHPVESLVNFVCTGVDDFDFSTAGLSFTSDYASGIAAITKAPDDSILGYWAALKDLKGDTKPLALPTVTTDEFKKCRDEVANDLPASGPIGVTAVSARPEALTVAAVIAAVEATRTLIKDIMADVVKAKQQERLKVFIDENRKNYKAVLDQDLNSAEFDKAIARHRAAALAAPYYNLVDMMALSRSTQRSQIIALASQIDQELSDYDQVRAAPKPKQLAAVFTTINNKLEDYAAGKISLADAQAFFSEASDQVSKLQKDYAAAKKAIQPLTK